MTNAKHLCALSAAVLLTMGGCSQSDDAAPSGGSAVLPSDASPAMQPPSKSGGQPAADTAIAERAKAFMSELNQQQGQVETIAQNAKSLTDEKLNSLIDMLNEKLGAAKATLSELKSAPEGMVKDLEKEFEGLMAEVKNLYQQALDRLSELQKSGTLPGGLKIPGGG